MSPFNAFQFLQGLETLSLRMPRHCENTLKVAGWLQGRQEVTKVIHPSPLTGQDKARGTSS